MPRPRSPEKQRTLDPWIKEEEKEDAPLETLPRKEQKEKPIKEKKEHKKEEPEEEKSKDDDFDYDRTDRVGRPFG